MNGWMKGRREGGREEGREAGRKGGREAGRQEGITKIVLIIKIRSPIIYNTYPLLTEFEGCTASYGLSFFPIVGHKSGL